MNFLREQRGKWIRILATVLILPALGAVEFAAAEVVEGGAVKVQFTNPIRHSIVQGMVNVDVAVLGGASVSSATFYVDGVVQSANSPFGFAWDTAGLKNDTRHLLTAKAFDQAGNGTAESILVTVKSAVASSSTTVTVGKAAAELAASTSAAAGMALKVTLQGSGFAAGSLVFYDGPLTGMAAARILDAQTLQFELPLPSAAGAEAATGDSYQFVVQGPSGDQSSSAGLAYGTAAGGGGGPTFGSVYVFPNPWVRGHGKPLTFHADVPSGILVGANVKIFDVRGSIIQQKEMSPVGAGAGYNFVWSGFDLASGVYLYEVEFQFAGGSQSITNGKLAVIR